MAWENNWREGGREEEVSEKNYRKAKKRQMRWRKERKMTKQHM